MPVNFLRKIPFLSSLSRQDLQRVYRLGRILKVKAGATIFSKAQAGQHMFIVVSGRVKIYTQSNTKKRKTFAYLGRGDFFGEMALLHGKSRSASAQAAGESEVLLISKSEFQRLLQSDPKLSYYMLCSVTERLRRANEEIENLLFNKVVGRLSKVFHDLLENSSKPYEGGRLLRDKYTHQELADLVGTTREPLSRALSSLRRADLLDLRQGRYFISHPEKLGQLASPS